MSGSQGQLWTQHGEPCQVQDMEGKGYTGFSQESKGHFHLLPGVWVTEHAPFLEDTAGCIWPP